MVREIDLKIRIKEYKQGRVSFTAHKDLIKHINRWATSYAAEFKDPAAIEMVQAIYDYRDNQRLLEAKRIYKQIKSGKRNWKLTEKEKEILRGTGYEWILKKLGWY